MLTRLTKYLGFGKSDPKPWMPDDAIALLSLRLRRCKFFLEYGAGGSTFLAARSSCELIVSVESDSEFLENLRRDLPVRAKSDRFESVFVDIGPTRKLGYPIDQSRKSCWPSYAALVWEKIGRRGQSPDLVLIDGRFRVACWATSMLRALPGTIILFDDYSKRPRYHVVESVCPPRLVQGGLAEFLVPEAVDRLACQELVEAYQYKPSM